MEPRTRSFIAFLFFLAISFSASALGALFPPGEWYAGLNKPSWNPPNWLFGPVWTALYLMIATAGWRIWQKFRSEAKLELTFWGLQMVLNALWSWLFFGLQRPGLAFGEILALWLAIAATIVLFWRRDRAAGLLMVPYLLWVSFASLLNFTLWQMNP